MEIPLCIIIWILLASKAFYSLWVVSWSDNNRLQFFSRYLLKDSWSGMFKDSKDTEWSLVYIWLLKLPPISLFLLSTVFSNWLRSKELVRICETLLAASIIVPAIPPSIFLACVLTTIVYAVIGYILRSKTLIWSLTLCSLFYVEEAVRILRRFSVIEVVHEDETFEKATVLQSAAALIILRASSVGLEFANKPSSLPRTVLVNQLALPVLLEAVCYATYPPTFYFGPLVSFSDWCAWRKEVFQVSYKNAANQIFGDSAPNSIRQNLL
nr:unnamed protein product [Spirometra erinaceieuropaei]